MTIEHALQEFLVEIEVRKYSPKTIKGYRNNLKRFCNYLGTRDIEDLQMKEVKRYMLFMAEQGRKGTYINGVLKNIKSFIQYCYDEGYGGFNTRHNFKWCKEEKPIIRAFTPADVKKILKDCGGYDFLSVRDKAILTMLFETGIRCWELCCIKREDIKEDFIIINGKNHKQRVVPITPVLKKALLKHDRAAKAYFRNKSIDDSYFLSFHGRKLTVEAVEHIIKRHGTGIEEVRVSPHTCRHFFAQQQMKMGTDIYTISRLLGHENIQITQTYLDSLRNEEIIEMSKDKSVLMNI